MRRKTIVALLVATPLFALGSMPADAGGWYRGYCGYGYAPSYYYRPYYGYRYYAPYYRPRYYYGGFFYRPRGWGFGYRPWAWGGTRWGWHGWRRW